MYGLASRLIDTTKNIIIVYNEQFKEGICGIVANRLMHDIHKPVIVFSKVGSELKGSGRSMNNTNIYEYLKEIEYLFTNFGGHAHAVGLTIDENRLDELLEYIDNNPFEYNVKGRDVLLVKQDELNEKLLDEIDELKPFGTGFDEPLLAIKNVEFVKKYTIAGKYPKYTLNNHLQAISFNTAHLNASFDIMIGKLQKDAYSNNKLSFIIEDLM